MAAHVPAHVWGIKTPRCVNRYTAAEGRAGVGVKPAQQHHLVVQSTKHTQRSQLCVCCSLFCVSCFTVLVRAARASLAAPFVCLDKKKSRGTCDLLAPSSALRLWLPDSIRSAPYQLPGPLIWNLTSSAAARRRRRRRRCTAEGGEATAEKERTLTCRLLHINGQISTLFMCV